MALFDHLRSLWDHPEVTLGSLWAYFRIILKYVQHPFLHTRLCAHCAVVPGYKYLVQGHCATRSWLGRVALQPERWKNHYRGLPHRRFDSSRHHILLLPHIPQATTTEQHETRDSLKNSFRRLNYIPHMPQATAHSTSYHD